MSIKINKDNYASYKKVLDIIWKNIHKDLDSKFRAVLSEVSPVEIMNKWENEIPKSKLYLELKQALADSVIMITDFPKLVAVINKELEINNLPNVQALNALVLGTISKVIKQEKIKNIDEYYVIKDLVDDNISDISNEERILLSKLLGDFENRIEQSR